MCRRSSWPDEKCSFPSAVGAALWKQQSSTGFVVGLNWEICEVRNAYNFHSVVQGSKPPLVSPWAASLSSGLHRCFLYPAEERVNAFDVGVFGGLNEGTDVRPRPCLWWSPSGRTREVVVQERCWRRRECSIYVHKGFGLNPSIILVFISHSINLSCVSGNCLFALGSYSYISVNIF